jgi:uncharacterized protein
MRERPIEHRYASQWLKRAELTTGDGLTIGGFAVPFEKRAVPLGGFVEIVERSFFNKSKADGWPRVVSRLNRNDMAFVGTTAGKTLRLSTDNIGLTFEADVPQALSVAKEYFERGDVADVALAWQVFEDAWTHESGYPVRRLITGRVVEVSPIMMADPALMNVEPALHSLAEHIGGDVTFERVAHLSDRNNLRWLFGDYSERDQEHEPVLLGKWGRAAHVELIESQNVGVPSVLDAYAVTVKPDDLVNSEGK